MTAARFPPALSPPTRDAAGVDAELAGARDGLAEGGERSPRRRRGRVLGREPVVDAEHARSAASASVRQSSSCLSRSPTTQPPPWKQTSIGPAGRRLGGTIGGQGAAPAPASVARGPRQLGGRAGDEVAGTPQLGPRVVRRERPNWRQRVAFGQPQQHLRVEVQPLESRSTRRARQPALERCGQREQRPQGRALEPFAREGCARSGALIGRALRAAS